MDTSRGIDGQSGNQGIMTTLLVTLPGLFLVITLRVAVVSSYMPSMRVFHVSQSQVCTLVTIYAFSDLRRVTVFFCSYLWQDPQAAFPMPPQSRTLFWPNLSVAFLHPLHYCRVHIQRFLLPDRVCLEASLSVELAASILVAIRGARACIYSAGMAPFASLDTRLSVVATQTRLVYETVARLRNAISQRVELTEGRNILTYRKRRRL